MTTAQDVFDSFESSFQDKHIIPTELELIWLKKAIGRYSVELDELAYSIVLVEPEQSSETETEQTESSDESNENEEIVEQPYETIIFNDDLNQYVIDTLAAFMKQSYMEREVSKVNKRVQIVTKNLSINGNGSLFTAAKNELEYDASKSIEMIDNQKPTAYV